MQRRDFLSFFLATPSLVDVPRADPGGSGQDEEAEWLGAMSGLLGQNRWDALLELAQRLYETAPRGDAPGSAREVACYLIFQAHLVLVHREEAFHAGERYLEEYPEGMHAFAVRLNLQVQREQESAREDALASVRGELDRIERELSAMDAQWATARLETPEAAAQLQEQFALRRAVTEFQVCTLLASHKLHAQAVRACTLFAEKYHRSEDANIPLLARSALHMAMMQEAAQGHFQEARKLGARLQAWAPQFAHEHGVTTLMLVWPH
ncbi:hypothetical protein [Archangium violaceum]|uniref:Uncharacterized protein n=1 Tax=Archangium violaceum Cb vi76 TaxID=1406225 RepID=A0A084SYM1_9BACT|nr:hypothetical protein [Archangium violaceum]KFA93556.1 hypothetical protein Q664_08110 [Archangium violaceum Cb vi76]